MLNSVLKKYDKKLFAKKNLDGSVQIYRKSPYGTVNYEILVIENKYFGSYRWLLRSVALMDSSRRDFFVNVKQKNNDIRNLKKDSRQSQDVAEYLINSGMTFNN